jgi:hypothetical protein
VRRGGHLGQFAKCFEELVGEGAAHDSGGGQGSAAVVAEAFQASSEYEAQALRHVQLGDHHFVVEESVRTVEAALLCQVLEHLLGEERVALALCVYGGHE